MHTHAQMESNTEHKIHRMAHGMVVFWMGLVTFLYVYIPVCLIHLILCFIEKRRARKN